MAGGPTRPHENPLRRGKDSASESLLRANFDAHWDNSQLLSILEAASSSDLGSITSSHDVENGSGRYSRKRVTRKSANRTEYPASHPVGTLNRDNNRGSESLLSGSSDELRGHNHLLSVLEAESSCDFGSLASFEKGSGRSLPKSATRKIAKSARGSRLKRSINEIMKINAEKLEETEQLIAVARTRPSDHAMTAKGNIISAETVDIIVATSTCDNPVLESNPIRRARRAKSHRHFTSFTSGYKKAAKPKRRHSTGSISSSENSYDFRYVPVTMQRYSAEPGSNLRKLAKTENAPLQATLFRRARPHGRPARRRASAA